MRTRAESVSFDAHEKSLDLDGNVRIDLPPFHLRSQHLRLQRVRWGIEAQGEGSIKFCPCLGTPLTIRFEKAIVAPPGELFLKSPRLELYGVPVMWLPWFWLRSDEKVGILPPEIAYRGQDGVYLGGGIHLPWKSRGARRTLDLRAGAYLDGGLVADGRLTTPTSTTKVRYDRLAGAHAPVLLVPGASADPNADDGLLIDARGSAHDDTTGIVWDADVLRGRRGVAATSDLDAAAKPWDRIAATGSVRVGPVRAESGMRFVTRRGGDLREIEAAGPFLALRSSGSLGGHITYDGTLEGGAVRVTGAAAPGGVTDTLTYARAEAGLRGAKTVGPLLAAVDVRGAGDVAAEGRASGSDGAGTARVRVSLPLARDFEPDSSDDPYARNDPWQHVVEPFVEGAILHQAGSNLLGIAPGRGLAALRGTAPIADGGLRSTLGRWGTREAIEVAVAGGAAFGDDVDGTRPIARTRLAASFERLGATIESGHVLGGSGAGNAVSARARLGRTNGPRLTANVAATGSVDPILARALTDPALEAPSGFFARSGTTGGGGVAIPWNKLLTTSAGADYDASAPALVAVRGGVELRDRCGCVALRTNAAHRIGRQGVDVWLIVDFATDR